MVHNIVRTAWKFPEVHRPDGSSRYASTEVHGGATKLSSLPLRVHDNAKAHELVPVLSTMQDSEYHGGAYDPSGKYTYQDLEQPHHDDLTNKKTIIMVDEMCRSKMLDWSSKMVDYFEIDRSIVFVAAYYQDRFLGTKMGESATNDRALFRVVSVTSLYLAIKLRASHRWNVTSHAFAQLCQGSVSGDDINDMESNILFALGWNVNPPIPHEYAESYLDLIFNSSEDGQRRRSLSSHREDDSVLGDCLLPHSGIDSFEEDASLQELKEHLLELIRYQLEIALQNSRLFQVRWSVIATAAVLNALEGVMSESPSLHDGVGGTSFFQASIILTLNTMASCKIASEKELENVRLALLNSVVSPTKGSKGLVDERSATIHNSNVLNCVQPPPRSDSPTVSSSPTSASKFWSPNNHALTPHTVLLKYAIVDHSLEQDCAIVALGGIVVDAAR